MTSEDLGYKPIFENFRIGNIPDEFETGRIIAEHRERYIVKTLHDEYEAEITGNLRFSARNREDFPAVGDWVAIQVYDELAIIHRIFPRFSVIKRQAVGQQGEIQIIASNIDLAFLVQAADRDFNLNRLERYLTICYDSGVRPVIILSKTDLSEPSRLIEIKERISERIKNVPLIQISNLTMDGYEQLKPYLVKGITCCLLGSSGVGKSTLLNNLSGRDIMKTGAGSKSTGKGRHVTSHRELIILENGGILIDNPGLREVGIADSTAGLESTFDHINSLSGNCRYRDCSHSHESGCAVIEALEDGTLDRSAYNNYLKMQREQAHFQASLVEKREKDREFGKMFKNWKKEIKKRKNR